MDNEILQDKLLEYVMGSLTPEEEREIEIYLNDHPTDAAYVRDMFEVMAEVALSQEPEALPANAEASLLERIRNENAGAGKVIKLEPIGPESVPKAEADETVKEQATGARRVWLGFALAAALAILAYIGFRPRVDPISRQLTQVCAEQGTVCEPVQSDNGELGTLAKRANNRVFLVLNEDPPAGQVYQAWEIADGTPISLGISSSRVFDIAEPLGSDSIFGITIEPAGGSPQPTSNPILAVPLS
ncbi:MAG: anti-sigma factor [Trueperaceae bacterium]|nr:anti-sigma factor [Trueperaceae bacterium]